MVRREKSITYVITKMEIKLIIVMILFLFFFQYRIFEEIGESIGGRCGPDGYRCDLTMSTPQLQQLNYIGEIGFYYL